MTQEEKVLRLTERPSLFWLNPFLKTFQRAEVFFVGGCVRDALLNRPIKDVDIVIRSVATTELEEWFSRNGSINFVGKTFGVYKFVPKGFEEEMDIALPRTEQPKETSRGGYTDFDVEARSDLPIEMDLARRDFTINAMAFDLRAKRLVDPSHGMRDLEAKLLRTVGVPKERFEEDLTRLLRAIRFACTLGFHIEETTLKAMQELTTHLNRRTDASWIVPREMVGREFLLTFFADPICALTRYEGAGFLSVLFPTIDSSLAKRFVQDVAGLPPKILLALFLLSTHPDEAIELFKQYHFSQFPQTDRRHISLEEIGQLLRSVHLFDVMENPSLLPGSTFERLFCGARGDDLLSLLTIVRPQETAKHAQIQERKERIRELWGAEIPILITGADLIAMGLPPGPAFRTIQQAIRDAQVDGNIKTKDEALELVKHLSENKA